MVMTDQFGNPIQSAQAQGQQQITLPFNMELNSIVDRYYNLLSTVDDVTENPPEKWPDDLRAGVIENLNEELTFIEDHVMSMWEQIPDVPDGNMMDRPIDQVVDLEQPIAGVDSPVGMEVQDIVVEDDQPAPKPKRKPRKKKGAE